jgi:DNA-binding NtrC family response regulator
VRTASAPAERLRTYLFSSARAFKSHTDFEKAVCVILDINLNDGSEIELRHGLKAAGVSAPVIYVTGNEDPAVREAALNSGCIAFLTKPFSVNRHANFGRRSPGLGGQYCRPNDSLPTQTAMLPKGTIAQDPARYP